jgi:hypothetical protein
MKKLAMMAILFAASMAASDVSGIWDGSGGIESAKYGMVPLTAQLTLIQSGSSVTGTYRRGNGKPGPITSGAANGGQITFVISSDGSTATLTQNSNGQLQGKITSSTGDVFDVVFTKE